MTQQTAELPPEILRLEQAFRDARTEDFAPEIYERFIDEDPETMDLNGKFQALNVAYMANLRDTLEARIDLMRYTLQFWSVIFNEMEHTPANVEAMTTEISGDVDVHRALLAYNNSEIGRLLMTAPGSNQLTNDAQIKDMSLVGEFQELETAVNETINRKGPLEKLPSAVENVDMDVEACESVFEKLRILREKMTDQLRFVSDLHVRRADILLECCFFTSATMMNVSDTQGNDSQAIVDTSINIGEASLNFSKTAVTEAIPHYTTFPERLENPDLSL